MATEQFYAHGKLLLTGEYLVLKGAKALAMPTAYGQSLQISDASENLHWESKDEQGRVWFSAVYDRKLNILQTNDSRKAEFLKKLLAAALNLSERNFAPAKAETRLEFPRNWGLGSSSTLTSLIAQWFQVDAFDLFFATQNGSGYDIACADADAPVMYAMKETRWEQVTLPDIFDSAFFIHLNKKQRSSPEVRRFLQNEIDKNTITDISALSVAFLNVKTEQELQHLIYEHERLTRSAIGLLSVKERLFFDFDGAIKSLGAWGGDFVMAVGGNVEEYFAAKGFNTVIKFREMLL